MITTHHFINQDKNKVDVYWYEDRYRYCVNTDKGIEYRELSGYLVDTITDTKTLESWIYQDMSDNPYGPPQMTNKCIRCSNRHGAPRKTHNLASICERCYKICTNEMNETADTSNTAGRVWYSINEDGSKGTVIKEHMQ